MGHSETIWSLKVYKLLKLCLKQLLLTERIASEIALIFPPTNENSQNYRLRGYVPEVQSSRQRYLGRDQSSLEKNKREAACDRHGSRESMVTGWSWVWQEGCRHGTSLAVTPRAGAEPRPP